jgi:hypothetical protein
VATKDGIKQGAVLIDGIFPPSLHFVYCFLLFHVLNSWGLFQLPQRLGAKAAQGKFVFLSARAND